MPERHWPVAGGAGEGEGEDGCGDATDRNSQQAQTCEWVTALLHLLSDMIVACGSGEERRGRSTHQLSEMASATVQSLLRHGQQNGHCWEEGTPNETGHPELGCDGRGQMDRQRQQEGKVQTLWPLTCRLLFTHHGSLARCGISAAIGRFLLSLNQWQIPS